MTGGDKEEPKIIEINTEELKAETDDIINLVNDAEEESSLSILTNVEQEDGENGENNEEFSSEETKKIIN